MTCPLQLVYYHYYIHFMYIWITYFMYIIYQGIKQSRARLFMRRKTNHQDEKIVQRYLFIYLSMYLSLSTYLFIYISLNPPICLYINLSYQLAILKKIHHGALKTIKFSLYLSTKWIKREWNQSLTNISINFFRGD